MSKPAVKAAIEDLVVAALEVLDYKNDLTMAEGLLAAQAYEAAARLEDLVIAKQGG